MNFLALTGSSYETTARGILYVIYEILWKLMYYVLMLIDEVSKLFYKVAGINVSDGVVENKNMFDQLLNQNVITGWYGIFIAISTGLVLVFSMIAILKATLSSDEKRSMGPILKNMGLALLLMIVVGPIVLFVISLISNLAILIAQIGGNSNISISDIIFNNSGNLLEVYNQTFATEFTSFRDLGNEFIYGLISEPKEGVVKLDFYWFIGLLGGVYILYHLICIVIDIVKRIFNIVILYVASPFVISKIALDDGKSFRDWQAKFFYEFVLLLSQMGTFMIFAALVNVLSNIDFEGLANSEVEDTGIMPPLYEPIEGETEEVVETFSLLNGLGRTLIMMAAASVTRSSATMLADILKGKESKTDNLLESLISRMSSRSGQPTTRTRTITRNTTTTKLETVFVEANKSGSSRGADNINSARGSAGVENVTLRNNITQNVNITNKVDTRNTFNNRSVKEGVRRGGYAGSSMSPGAVYINASRPSDIAPSGNTFKIMEQGDIKEASSAMNAYAAANTNLTSAIQSGNAGKLQKSLSEYTKAYAKEADMLGNSYRQFEMRAQDSMKSSLSNQAKQELTNISNAYRKAQMDYSKTAQQLKQYDGERISTADALKIKEQADKQRERLMNASNRAAQFYNNQKKEE